MGEKDTIRLWEPGAIDELVRKVTPALYCELLGRELERNRLKCKHYQPIKLLSRCIRPIELKGSPGHPRLERKEELPHYCVLCHHSRSIKDRPH